jgi:hypothetical protein
MKGCIYLYLGHSALSKGSFDDLQRLGITPEEGMTLNFYDLDADEHNRPTYLCARGVLYRDDFGNWHAEIERGSFHTVLRSEVDD